jgi:hypothetical protein
MPALVGFEPTIQNWTLAIICGIITFIIFTVKLALFLVDCTAGLTPFLLFSLTQYVFYNRYRSSEQNNSAVSDCLIHWLVEGWANVVLCNTHPYLKIQPPVIKTSFLLNFHFPSQLTCTLFRKILLFFSYIHADFSPYYVVPILLKPI